MGLGNAHRVGNFLERQTVGGALVLQLASEAHRDLPFNWCG